MPKFDMPTYKGNAGNLLQHWVLCEILVEASHHATELSFIDAHSMAPWAETRNSSSGYSSRVFDCVCRDLPGQRSAYESTWHTLSGLRSGYPNSANFVCTIWPGRCSLLLCESDPETVKELREWTRGADFPRLIDRFEVAEGDWRSRFRRGLPTDSDLTFLSFDPMISSQSRKPSRPNPSIIYRNDVDRIARAIDPIAGSLVVQLSTYTANGPNPQADVHNMVKEVTKPFGLELVANVHYDGHMMSLVLGRDLKFADNFSSLPSRFESWVRVAKKRR